MLRSRAGPVSPGTPAPPRWGRDPYPQLTCDGHARPLYTGVEVGFSSSCIDNEVTYRFLDDVVGQLAWLTPGTHLHLGGDEAHSTEPSAYVRFVERAEQIVRGHCKQIIGWAEISAANLSGTGLAQYWNPATGTEPGTETATRAVAQGLGLVVSPASKAYLDMKYTGPRWDSAGPVISRSPTATTGTR